MQSLFPETNSWYKYLLYPPTITSIPDPRSMQLRYTAVRIEFSLISRVYLCFLTEYTHVEPCVFSQG
jgi:hypothetical protein